MLRGFVQSDAVLHFCILFFSSRLLPSFLSVVSLIPLSRLTPVTLATLVSPEVLGLKGGVVGEGAKEKGRFSPKTCDILEAQVSFRDFVMGTLLRALPAPIHQKPNPKMLFPFELYTYVPPKFV